LVGTYTLTYSSPSTPALGTQSQTIGLAAGVATQMVITTPPGGAASGSPLSPQPVLQLEDGAGNSVTQAGVNVTVTINSGPGSFTGGSTTTVQSDANGAITFTNLAITGAGSYTLLFTAALTTPTITSGSFTITP
ncbi:MAG TPA: hypothetical protein VEQ10_05765, partial [Vicinamibacteria bacterium]|nr:hypothetical protein [Vicinamibacteria bacterium]